MLDTQRRNRSAFTLIELLVVVAIIALLISILLPSLTCARDKARTAKCGAQMRGIGTGMSAYMSEFDEWFPGANTTGVQTEVAARGANKITDLRRASTPAQNVDWMSPALRYDTELGQTRAQRFQTLVNDYRCPSMGGLTIDFLYPPGVAASPDSADFSDETLEPWAPLSYLMPVHFQWWGHGFANMVIADAPPRVRVRAKVPPGSYESPAFETRPPRRYQSRLSHVGPPSQKIAAADGMRYMTAAREIDFDVQPFVGAPPLYDGYFGSFTSTGAWWGGGQAYGVTQGSSNWDNNRVQTGGAQPAAGGENLLWSYRHGCRAGNLPTGCRDNSGAINALFFDGHVKLLNDRESREIVYWYPSGSVVVEPNSGLTTVPMDFEIP